MKIGFARVCLALALFAAVQSIIDEDRFDHPDNFLEHFKPKSVCLKRRLKGKADGDAPQATTDDADQPEKNL